LILEKAMNRQTSALKYF